MNNKKLIDILEMHDAATEDYGLPGDGFCLLSEPSAEEWNAFLAEHRTDVAEITEEEFEEQKKAA